MNERALTAKVHQAVAAAAAEHQELVTIGSIRATRGWGDILFVRVHAQLRDATSPDVREAMEGRFQSAVRQALDGDRTSVSVTWSSD